MELFITGEPFDAKRAVEVGLLTATVPADGLDDGVGRYISMILKGAPGAVAGAKQLVRDIPGMEMDAAFSAMAARSAVSFGSEEALEGMKAFAEKRPPKWQEELV
jgi:methylglutaconyl-CoA hydratase